MKRLLRQSEPKIRGNGEEDPSFCLFSPRFDLDTPRTGRNPDPLFALIQQLEKTDDKSVAQIRNLRENLTRSSLKPGFSSHRSPKDSSLIPTFTDFEEINLSNFDFMEDEVKLPDTITRDMNLEQVQTAVLLGRAEELHGKVCGSLYTAVSLELLGELDEREALLQRREGLKREIGMWLEE